jgi:ribosomal protein L7/L12
MNTELIRCLSAAYDLADSVATKQQIAGLLMQEVGPVGGNGMLTPAEMMALANDQKITAIKLYRERTATSLKESKDVIDGFQASMLEWHRRKIREADNPQ